MLSRTRVLGTDPRSEYYSHMFSRGIPSTFLSALILGVLLVPYGRPVICDLTDHSMVVMPDSHGKSGNTLIDFDGMDGCHGNDVCTATNVAPVFDPMVAVSVLPEHRELRPQIAVHPNRLLARNLSPPPRA